MRNLILSALILASAFQTALGQIVEGQWTYIVENGGATITASTATGAVTIPSELGGYAVKKVGTSFPPVFGNGNTSVTSVTIPNSVTTIGTYAFYGCTGLTSVVLGSSVTRIGSYVFFQCRNLTSITIPNNVTSIGTSAFSECIGLTSITIPNNVTSIGTSAFSGCTALTSVTIPNLMTLGDLFPNSSNLLSVTLAEGASAIRDAMFSGKSSLTSVTIPNSVTSIGSNAFNSCTGLTSVVVTNANPNYSSMAGVLFDKNQTTLIKYPEGKTGSYTIPNSVISIGGYAFSGCVGLASITIPSSVASIGVSAFSNCTSLYAVIFLGNEPDSTDGVFTGSEATVYYLAESTGWSSTFSGRPTSTGSITLTVTCDTNKGLITTTPQSAAYIPDTAVTILATPKAGYLFTSWTGDSTGTSTSISLTLNTNKTLTANFAEDTGDNDSDGLTNFQESITYGTNPNQKDTNSDGVEDGLVISSGYSTSLNFSALTAHWKINPPTGLYTSSQYSENYAAGQQNVISNPNTHNLYTTSQIQYMTVGSLFLTRQASGDFVLNCDLEQSTDLQNWTTYQSFAFPLTGFPSDKAFVRFKAKE